MVCRKHILERWLAENTHWGLQKTYPEKESAENIIKEGGAFAENINTLDFYIIYTKTKYSDRT